MSSRFSGDVTWVWYWRGKDRCWRYHVNTNRYNWSDNSQVSYVVCCYYSLVFFGWMSRWKVERSLGELMIGWRDVTCWTRRDIQDNVNFFLHWFDNFFRRHPQRKTRKKTKKELVCRFFIYFCKIMFFTMLVSFGHVLLYSNLANALKGEINCKFVSLFLCLLVLVWDSYLQLFSLTSGKRTSNKRILESTSKENFKVCYQLYLCCTPKHNNKSGILLQKKHKHKKKLLQF